jgi:hypothetical protein
MIIAIIIVGVIIHFAILYARGKYQQKKDDESGRTQQRVEEARAKKK